MNKKAVCSRCKNEKSLMEFHLAKKSKRGVQSYCKVCKAIINKENYEKKKGCWIYIICIDGIVVWCGSTNNLSKRLNAHWKRRESSNIIYMLETIGIEWHDSEIKVYACDMKEMGLNLSKSDLEYYEHWFIRRLIDKGHHPYNKRTTADYDKRERYIDEIPLIPRKGFKFEEYTVKVRESIKITSPF